MGKGSRTSQSNVVKKLSQLTADKELLLAGAVAGGDEGQEKEHINQCMVKFDARIVDVTGSIVKGDSVTLVPEGSAGVQIIHQGHKVSSYTDDLASTLIDCMRAGYIYKGEVIDINTSNSVVTCRIQGLGRL